MFSKFDLSQAYQQVCLDHDSRKLLTINTQKGLFQYTQLPFGVASALGVLQRIMESILQGITQVSVYLDIQITGQTETEHLRRLDEVLARLEESELCLNWNKCIFIAKSVSYLGH